MRRSSASGSPVGVVGRSSSRRWAATPSAVSDGPSVLMADNGRKSFEIDAKSAAQFYRLISATKREVELLKKAGFRMEACEDFEPREG